MKKTGTLIARLIVIPLFVLGVIKGIGALRKHRKGKETDLSKIGNKIGKSVGETVDAVILKFSDIADTVKNTDGKAEEEINHALEMAKRELDKAAQSAKNALHIPS